MRSPRTYSTESEEVWAWKKRYLEATGKLLAVTNPVVPGWLTDNEGLVLRTLAASIPAPGCVLEIGSFCGKSTRYLLSGCITGGSHLTCIDPFTPEFPGEGEDWRKTPDTMGSRIDWESWGDTRPVFNTMLLETSGLTLEDVKCYNTVVHGKSREVAGGWQHLLDMVFIDGNHSECRGDVAAWLPHLKPHAVLCFHDVTEGQAVLYGADSPLNTVQSLLQNKWSVIAKVDGLACLTRDQTWWLVRTETLHDHLKTEVAHGTA